MSVALPDTAMVMAAGLGSRMRPLTDSRPKPLVKVGGTPLIDHALDHLAAAGIARAVVNVHHHADMLEAHLRARDGDPQILVSDERAMLLETGGGLVRAAPVIDRDLFFCLNSDNMWVDGPSDAFTLLARRWDDARMDALLLLIPHARAFHHAGPGDFHMDPAGRLQWRRPHRVAPYIFTGIQLLSRRILRDAPDGAFSTRLFWDRALAEDRLFGAVHEGLWFDVGTPRAIAPTEAYFAHG